MYKLVEHLLSNNMEYDQLANMIWIPRKYYNKELLNVLKDVNYKYKQFNSCGSLLYIEF